MPNKDLAVVILAAGKGTRLKSSFAKVLHRAGGRPLIEHVVRACSPLNARKTIVVVGHQAEEVTAAAGAEDATIVLQQPQHGTGHAMQLTRRVLGNAKFAVVLAGDAPLVRPETLKALLATHRNGDAAATILTAVVADPAGTAEFCAKSETAVSAIVEESQLTGDQAEINEINSAIYCFTLAKLWPALAQVKPNNKHRELYLTDAVAVLAAKGEKVLAQVAADSPEVLGCNTRADLAEVDRIFREWKRAAADGSGSDHPIAGNCLDRSGSGHRRRYGHRARRAIAGQNENRGALHGSHWQRADAMQFWATMLSLSRIAWSRKAAWTIGVIIGPFARLRAGNHLKAGVRIGNFVELKKSTLGEGTKAMHLTYLGDAKIGSKTNIGAGTITCNYDGFHKHPTTIGNKVFIGSDSALVAPVRVGDGAFIAAGSTITENVPPDGLGIARSRQANKAGLGQQETPRTCRRLHAPKIAAKKSRRASKKRRR